MRTISPIGCQRSPLDLVRRQVAVIACNGDAAAAAKAATATIPIVFATGEEIRCNRGSSPTWAGRIATSRE